MTNPIANNGEQEMDYSRYPEAYRKDIEKAVKILTDAGCKEVYIFGSLSKGIKPSHMTDIDIAIRGLPAESFFIVYGTLLFNLDHDVDLVDLDLDPAFAEHLLRGGQLARVA